MILLNALADSLYDGCRNVGVAIEEMEEAFKTIQGGRKMRLRERVWELELDVKANTETIKGLETRIGQMDCEHDPVAIDRGRSAFSFFSDVSGRYRTECSKCGKVLKDWLTEKEYLEFKLGNALGDSVVLQEKLDALEKEADDG